MVFRWILVAALGIYLAHRCVNYFNGNDGLKKRFTRLVIGILSARENFELRSTIRKTWLNFSQIPSLKNNEQDFRAWFIIGDEPCKVPPPCRRNKYECSRWDLNVSGVEKTFCTAVESTIKSTLHEKPKDVHQGFSFHVHHPLVVQKLGVLYDILPLDQEVLVSILDLQTKETIVNATVSHMDYDVMENGFLYKNVEKFLLPKDYQGLLLVEGYLLKAYDGEVVWNSNGGVLSFNKIYISTVDAESISFDDSLQVAPSIYFSVDSIDALSKRANECEESFEEWNNYTSEITLRLGAEKEEWSDMVFVKIVDIYRNLPRKLLLFYNWLVPHYRFDFVLKTDDDCSVDVESLMDVLYEREISPQELLVWSKFRSEWPVNYIGKWADHNYKSPVYPTFPCGGGYVLSHEVVSWLHNNSAYLYPFQGEDVSLGIWMSAVNPVYVEDSNWECNEACSINSYNRAQLKPHQMINSWSNKLKCGNICHCDLEYVL